MANNYNHNKDGVSVSIELWADSDNYEFKENFKHIEGDTYFYKDYGNMKYDEKAKFEEVELYGYSQGDYVKVLVDTNQFRRVSGSDFDRSKYKEYFQNIIFDTRIDGQVVIGDMEIYSIGEIIENNYADELTIKDEIIAWVQQNFNKETSEEVEKVMEEVVVKY